MIKVNNRPASRKRRKKIIKAAKGFYGRRKSVIRNAKNAVMKAGQYSYDHRRLKKRNFRTLWIERIGVAARINGLSYNTLINALNKMDCKINRKMLAMIALEMPESFTALVNEAKKTLNLA